MSNYWFILSTFVLLYGQQSEADIGIAARTAAAYPAAGFRPNRRFNLPNETPQPPVVEQQEDIQPTQQRHPDLTYGVPPAARQQQNELQQENQFFLVARNSPMPARLRAASARLAVNSEAKPDDEADAEVLDVQPHEMPQQARGIVPNTPQASTVYYPAGAVSFVQPIPGSFARPVPQPTAPFIAPNVAQASYVQPLQLAQLEAQPQFQVQPLQPEIRAAKIEAPRAGKLLAASNFYAAPATLTASPAVSFAPAKFQQQMQPAIHAAKIEEQPTLTSPIAYTAPAAAFNVAPAAAFTSTTVADYAQPQFFVATPAQLQAW